MKIQSASSALQEPVRTKVRSALAADDEVIVPLATPPETTLIRSFLTSPEGERWLTDLKSGSQVKAPVLRLDLATWALVKQATAEAKLARPATHPTKPAPQGLAPGSFTAQQRLVINAGGGALLGGGLAALCEITRHAEPTGTMSALLTLVSAAVAGAATGAGAATVVTTGLLSGSGQGSFAGFKLKVQTA